MKERPILFSGPMVRAILEGRKTQTRRIVNVTAKGVLSAYQRKNGFQFNAEAAHVGDLSWIPALAGSAEGVAEQRKCQQLNVPMRHPDDAFLEWEECGCNRLYCPHGEPGDRLWVRETWRPFATISTPSNPPKEGIIYAADNARVEKEGAGKLWKMDRANKWRPSIHMPRWASRLTLEIVAVRVERLQDISEGDAKAEGVNQYLGSSEPETWWQGYDGRFTDRDGNLSHTQVPRVDTPPDWLIEPKKMIVNPIPVLVVPMFESTWESINGADSWAANPWVWVVEFKRITP